MSDSLIVRRNGPVLHLINNNPAARNALSVDYCQGLVAALEGASADASVAAVVLSGAQGYFCSGGDVNILKTRAAMTVDQRISSINLLHDVIRAIQACTRPVIAAVEGGAAGAGVSLALACDLLISHEDAYISVAYVKIGLSPDGGATALLSQIAPRQLVNELCMFGDRLPMQRLAELGAVNRLVAADLVLAEAQAWGERLNGQGPEALAAIKDLNNSAVSNSMAQQLDKEAKLMAAAQGGREGAEGIAAFLEKRKPDFTKFRK